MSKTEDQTKREIIAALALQGILANSYALGRTHNSMQCLNQGDAAKQAVSYADALLEELNKSNK